LAKAGWSLRNETSPPSPITFLISSMRNSFFGIIFGAG
jgi:hypothetical protein